MATDVFGATAVLPAYFGLTAIKNSGPVANIMVGRPVRPAAIKSLVPATVIGFAIAAAAFWLAVPSKGSIQAISLWRLAPLLIAPLTQIIYSRTGDAELLKNDKKGFLDVNNQDLPSLKMLYGTVTVATAAAHFGLVSLPWLTGKTDSNEIANMFGNRETLALAGGLAGGAVATVLGARVQGYVTTWGAIGASLVSLISVPIFGPAAVFTGVSYWKEVTMAKFCFWKHGNDSSRA